MSMAFDIDPDSNTVQADRHLRSSGSSTILSIPPQILNTLDWEADDPVKLVANWEEETLTIQKIEEEK